MTAVSTVTDEAVEAAAKALSPDLFSDEENLMHPALRLSGQWQVRHKVRAALEAAVPYLAPKVDQEALIEVLLDAHREANQRDVSALARQGWPGIPPVPEDALRQHCSNLIDLLMPLISPHPPA